MDLGLCLRAMRRYSISPWKDELEVLEKGAQRLGQVAHTINGELESPMLKFGQRIRGCLLWCCQVKRSFLMSTELGSGLDSGCSESPLPIKAEPRHREGGVLWHSLASCRCNGHVRSIDDGFSPCQLERMDVVTKGMGTLLKTSNKQSWHGLMLTRKVNRYGPHVPDATSLPLSFLFGSNCKRAA